MADWKMDILDMMSQGLNLVSDPKDAPPGSLVYSKNVIAQQEGALQPRPGLTKINATPILGIPSATKTIRSNAQAESIRIMSAGPFLYRGVSVFTTCAGWLGDGYALPAMIPWRNQFDQNTYLYCSDGTDFKKVTWSGNALKVGVDPPEIEIPNPVIATEAANLIDALTTVASISLQQPVVSSAWVSTGSYTINAIKPTRLVPPSGAQTVVEATLHTAASTYVIERAVAKDLSSTFPADSRLEMFLRVDDPVKVKEVHLIFALDSSGWPPASGSDTNLSTLKDYYMITMPASDLAFVASGQLTSTSAYQLGVNIGQLPALATYVEQQLYQQWLNRGGQGNITNDPPPKVLTQDQAQEYIDSGQVKLPTTVLNRLGLGAGVWTAISVARKDFVRVGTDSTRDWSTVTGWAVRILTSDTLASNCTCDISDLSIGGLGGLDSSLGAQYDWRYTYWDATHGIESNPSPVMTDTYEVKKRSVSLEMRASADTNVTHMRVYRRGGALTDDWYRLEQIPNVDYLLSSAPNPPWIDYYDDLSVIANPTLSIENDVPFTTIGTRTNLCVRSEEFADASWTATTLTVTSNDTAAPDGTLTADLLKAGGGTGTLVHAPILQVANPFTFSCYMKRKTGTGAIRLRVGTVSSWQDVHIAGMTAAKDYAVGWTRVCVHATEQNPSMGIQIVSAGDAVWVWGAQFEQSTYPTPYIKTRAYAETVVDGNKRATKMAVIFGPFLGKYVFGLGDPDQPGRLYWTNPGKPDTASSINYLDVTDASEPLINGFVWDQRAYVWTRQNLYVIYPSLTGGSTFSILKTPCGMGLWNDPTTYNNKAAWGFAIGSGVVYFIGKNGIYETQGGAAVSITEMSGVRPLFYGQTIQNMKPVDWSVNATYMRLCFVDPFLYLVYWEVGGGIAMLRYHTQAKRWEWISYGVIQPTFVYWEDETRNIIVGDNSGYLNTIGGTNDQGYPISCQFRTACLSQGAPRNTKAYSDVMIEYDPDGATIQVIPYVDSYSTFGDAKTLPATAGRRRAIIPVTAAGLELKGRDLGLDFQWSSATAVPKIYTIMVSYLPLEDENLVWNTQWEDLQWPYEKYIKGISIEYEAAAGKTVRLFVDGSTSPTGDVLTLPASTGKTKYIAKFDNILARTVRLMATDSNTGWLYGRKWIYDREPPAMKQWQTQEMTFDQNSFSTVRYVYLDVRSTALVIMAVYIDGTAQAAINIPSTSGVRQKVKVDSVAISGKSWKFLFWSANDFKIYNGQTETHNKTWTQTLGWKTLELPFVGGE